MTIDSTDPIHSSPDRQVLLDELVAHLQLEQLEINLFRGLSHDIGSPAVFGGQVLGQALMAAARTVPVHAVHSLHAYFLRPGDKEAAIVYEVDRIRDGASFTTRRVTAIQHGKAIFHMTASFQQAEQAVEHQRAMPDAPGPQGMRDDHEVLREAFDQLPARARAVLDRQRPIDFRTVNPDHPIEPGVQPPHNQAWMRATGALPHDPILHCALLAYASDFSLLSVALRPHGLTYFQPNVQVVSLDHAMWFHRDFRFDDWLLYETDSPSATGARGFCRGSIFSRDGRLVASVAQEGLIRMRG